MKNSSFLSSLAWSFNLFVSKTVKQQNRHHPGKPGAPEGTWIAASSELQSFKGKVSLFAKNLDTPDL